MELYKQKYYEKLSNVDGVMLSCVPLHNQLHCDHDFEMPIMVQIVSGKLPENYPRKNINICVVLDRSGSMKETIQSCKDAIEQLINKLNENDIIHLVVYDEQVDVIFTNCTIKDRTQMIAKLCSVKERGSTDIYSGMLKGIDVLLGKKEKIIKQEQTTPSSSSILSTISNMIYGSSSAEQVNTTQIDSKVANDDRTKLLFLFSDGLANSGIVNGEEIGKMVNSKCNNNIYVSTFGIGNHYDDVLMSSIAYCGNGNYFYIQNANDIPQIVEKGLNGLTRYWTKNAKLEVVCDDGVVLIDKKELPETCNVREYALQRYLIKAKCSNNTAKIGFTLTFTDYQGTNRTKYVECSWTYLDQPKLDLVSDKQVRCYMTVRRCAEINKEIMQLMDNASENNSKIIQLKNTIVELYEGVLPDDEYNIIPILLNKEKSALDVMKTQGTTSFAASKQVGYCTLSTGHKTKMYKYTSSAKVDADKNDNEYQDGDIGFTSFM
ncbi:VWA-like protein [Fadolivirus algeromassiliense]|jgi:Ca-activated chloride channel family protein|uniref:VWA-like protein n=1 Tax=Fadolivirus FV1/VV64 TaxID=3070911 RepID=A0A7D3R1E0_9VIRU|nr:VWA-like protein [Fadolivirus algeromassiliense]QKF94422.1 VWA-like protein [Fadolivirus FV1/VV64]